MTYNRKILARIGKVVIQSHPELVSGILKEITPSPTEDLSKINEYLNCYCLALGICPETIKGPVYKSSITELKKVFISAMIKIYKDQFKFNKTISDILAQKHTLTTRMITEVKFRYSRDADFNARVEDTIKIITEHKQKLAS